jgi:hypothetical protein
MLNKVVPNDILIPEICKIIQGGTDVLFKPKGMSMLPFIIGGKDSVMLSKIDIIKPGDIVLAKVSENKFVLHRVEKIVGDVVVLMGDGNLVERERCSYSDLLAIAVKIIKGKREIDCRSKKHQARARMWKNLLPIRKYLLVFIKRIIL